LPLSRLCSGSVGGAHWPQAVEQLATRLLAWLGECSASLALRALRLLGHRAQSVWPVEHNEGLPLPSLQLCHGLDLFLSKAILPYSHCSIVVVASPLQQVASLGSVSCVAATARQVLRRWRSAGTTSLLPSLPHRRISDRMKAKVNLTLDKEVWRQFRVECIQRDTSASAELEAFIKTRLQQWEKGGKKK
jgi:hypothetical protein